MYNVSIEKALQQTEEHKDFVDLSASEILSIPDNTMVAWVLRIAQALQPLADAFWQQLSTVNLLQVDETPVKVLNPEKKGYMWLYHCYLPGKKFI